MKKKIIKLSDIMIIILILVVMDIPGMLYVNKYTTVIKETVGTFNGTTRTDYDYINKVYAYYDYIDENGNKDTYTNYSTYQNDIPDEIQSLTSNQ